MEVMSPAYVFEVFMHVFVRDSFKSGLGPTHRVHTCIHAYIHTLIYIYIYIYIYAYLHCGHISRHGSSQTELFVGG
jgi:hypothetical protein